MDAPTHIPPNHSALGFCTSRNVLRVVVLAQAVAILLALAPGVAEDRWFRLGMTTLFVQWVTLLTLLLLCLTQRLLKPRTPAQVMSIGTGLLLLTTTLVSMAAFHILTEEGWQPQTELPAFILHNLMIAAITALIGMQFYFMHAERQKILTAQARTELNALHAQIRPHFLFNTLNTAAELTHQDPQAAEQALLNLASLFRAAMQTDTISSLDEELALGRAYLELEQWRLGQRLQIHTDGPTPLPHIMLPTLTLQPLLENAIRHGIEPMPKGGVLDISIHIGRTTVTLLITNPRQTHTHSQTNGIALENIRQRLELIYGDQVQLNCHATDKLYRVKLTLPLTQGMTS